MLKAAIKREENDARINYPERKQARTKFNVQCSMKILNSIKYIIIHCVANRCNKPFSVEKLIKCGMEKYGQCSYHYYVRYDGTVVPLLPESVQGVHARGYNSCSLGVVYEGGLNENGVKPSYMIIRRPASWAIVNYQVSTRDAPVIQPAKSTPTCNPRPSN